MEGEDNEDAVIYVDEEGADSTQLEETQDGSNYLVIYKGTQDNSESVAPVEESQNSTIESQNDDI